MDCIKLYSPNSLVRAGTQDVFTGYTPIPPSIRSSPATKSKATRFMVDLRSVKSHLSSFSASNNAPIPGEIVIKTAR